MILTLSDNIDLNNIIFIILFNSVLYNLFQQYNIYLRYKVGDVIIRLLFTLLILLLIQLCLNVAHVSPQTRVVTEQKKLSTC